MPFFTSIDQYHTGLKNGSTTCVQAVEQYLSAIEKNKRLNCFIEIFAEEALQRAFELDRHTLFGKLHGVIIGIKDII